MLEEYISTDASLTSQLAHQRCPDVHKQRRIGVILNQNTELYDLFENYIELSEVRCAFNILVGAGAGLSQLECFPQQKGVIRDFRFFSKANKQPFAFIVNKKSLLFYLRLPAVSSLLWNEDKLSTKFADMSSNTRGEWTIPIKNRASALSMVDEVLLKWK
jgi:hypothetical protein